MKNKGSSRLRTVATVMGFAAVTAAATLAVCAPKTTFADGDDFERMGEYTEDGLGTKFQDVVVESSVARDARSKTGWMITLKAKNLAARSETVKIEEDLDRQFITPMARVGGEAARVISTKEEITLAANETKEIRHPVPAWVVPQLEQSEKMEKARAVEEAKQEKGEDANFQVLSDPYPHFMVTCLWQKGAKPADPGEEPAEPAPAATEAPTAPPPAVTAQPATQPQPQPQTQPQPPPPAPPPPPAAIDPAPVAHR